MGSRLPSRSGLRPHLADELDRETERLLAGGLSGDEVALERFLQFISEWFGAPWAAIGSSPEAAGPWSLVACWNRTPADAFELPSAVLRSPSGRPEVVGDSQDGGRRFCLSVAHPATVVVIGPTKVDPRDPDWHVAQWARTVRVVAMACAAACAQRELLALAAGDAGSPSSDASSRSGSSAPTRFASSDRTRPGLHATEGVTRVSTRLPSEIPTRLGVGEDGVQTRPSLDGVTRVVAPVPETEPKKPPGPRPTAVPAPPPSDQRVRRRAARPVQPADGVTDVMVPSTPTDFASGPRARTPTATELHVAPWHLVGRRSAQLRTVLFVCLGVLALALGLWLGRG